MPSTATSGQQGRWRLWFSTRKSLGSRCQSRCSPSPSEASWSGCSCAMALAPRCHRLKPHLFQRWCQPLDRPQLPRRRRQRQLHPRPHHWWCLARPDLRWSLRQLTSPLLPRRQFMSPLLPPRRLIEPNVKGQNTTQTETAAPTTSELGTPVARGALLAPGAPAKRVTPGAPNRTEHEQPRFARGAAPRSPSALL